MLSRRRIAGLLLLLAAVVAPGCQGIVDSLLYDGAELEEVRERRREERNERRERERREEREEHFANTRDDAPPRRAFTGATCP